MEEMGLGQCGVILNGNTENYIISYTRDWAASNQGLSGIGLVDFGLGLLNFSQVDLNDEDTDFPSAQFGLRTELRVHKVAVKYRCVYRLRRVITYL